MSKHQPTEEDRLEIVKFQEDILSLIREYPTLEKVEVRYVLARIGIALAGSKFSNGALDKYRQEQKDGRSKTKKATWFNARPDTLIFDDYEDKSRTTD